ncbi:MAG: hypothetical protein DMG05_14665 [Acidobacteria bacterium]|nr:MAG: hypothetical protein DMG05_14665 [Acidobacteriota bacterium]
MDPVGAPYSGNNTPRPQQHQKKSCQPSDSSFHHDGLGYMIPEPLPQPGKYRDQKANQVNSYPVHNPEQVAKQLQAFRGGGGISSLGQDGNHNFSFALEKVT